MILVATEVIIVYFNWAPSSEFVSSSIPSWQILTAHAQSFRGARDLAFCLKVPLDPMLVWESSWGSGETARMRSLAWTFAARIGDKYQILLTRSNFYMPMAKADIHSVHYTAGALFFFYLRFTARQDYFTHFSPREKTLDHPQAELGRMS